MSQKNLAQLGLYSRKKIENFSYGLEDKIGKGYSSQVFRGRNDETDTPVAVKVIDMKMLKSQINRQLLNSQIQILKKMRNYPNILQLNEVFTTRNNTYIITELCQGDLAKKIKDKITELQAIHYMKQLLKGYSYIFQHSIVHRDLKPANLLLTNLNILKIADFGFAVKAEELIIPNKYNVGSPLYMAPQSLKKNEYSFKSDVWSIGVIFYQMLTTETPWIAKNQKQLIKKIQQQNIEEILINKNFSLPVKDFITRALTFDKNTRLSPEQMIKFQLIPQCQMVLGQKKLNLTLKHQNLTEISTPHKSIRKTIPDQNHLVQPFIVNDKSYDNKNINDKSYDNKNNDKKKNLPDNSQNRNETPKYWNKMQPILNCSSGLKKQQKKHVSKLLISEVHLCRFLFKLLMRIRQSLNKGILVEQHANIVVKNVFQSYARLIYSVLHKISEFQKFNFLGIQNQLYQQYKKTSDFKKLLKISVEYSQRYSKDIQSQWALASTHPIWDPKIIYDTNSTICLVKCLKDKLEHLITQVSIKNINKHVRRHSSKEYVDEMSNIMNLYTNDIIIVDYLITSTQLLDIFNKNPTDYEGFARKSRIQEIVQGATANIDYQLYTKIIERATLFQASLKN